MSRLDELASRHPALASVAKLPKAAQLGIGAAVVALVVVAMLWMREPSYKVLFSNLADKDGGAIVSALSKMNVPYTMSDNGMSILVPGEHVHTARLQLAEQGLPQGGNVGFELMKDTQFGASQFAEQVTYQRAIEGELARSIEAMHSVASARVHLAVPKDTLFVRDRKQPTASVLLNLNSGRSIGDDQIAAIAWLVASSVPDLSVENVSIVDQTGRLLSSRSSAGGLGASTTQLKFQAELEERTAMRVLSILTPILGPGNIHTEVSAVIDFDQREQTSETYRPNQKPELAAVRSEQINTSAQRGAGPAQGVPGALSNEPPAPPQAPITAPAEGEEQAAPAGPSNETSSSTVNYEVDRTISHVKESVGQLKRMSVAVVVNYRTDADGSPVALDQAQMAQIENLVREAVGYSEARGDTLSVANTPFTNNAVTIVWWKDPFLHDLAKSIGQYLLIFVLALFVWFKLLKPLLAAATRNPEQPEPAVPTAKDAEAVANEIKNAGQQYEETLTTVREMVKKDPRAAAMILRGWMNQNA